MYFKKGAYASWNFPIWILKWISDFWSFNRDMMPFTHCLGVGGATSLHLSGIARWTRRDCFSAANCFFHPITPNKATRGFGSNLMFNTWDRVWKISIQYLSRLGHDRYVWRKASALLHLSQFGLTSGSMEDNLASEIWALCNIMNWDNSLGLLYHLIVRLNINSDQKIKYKAHMSISNFKLF